MSESVLSYSLPFISVLIIGFIIMVIVLAVLNTLKYKELDVVFYVKKSAVLEAEVAKLQNEIKTYKNKLNIAENQVMSNEKINDKINGDTKK